MTALVVFDLEAVLNFELARKRRHITQALMLTVIAGLSGEQNEQG